MCAFVPFCRLLRIRIRFCYEFFFSFSPAQKIILPPAPRAFSRFDTPVRTHIFTLNRLFCSDCCRRCRMPSAPKKYANRCTFVWCGLLDLQLPNSQNICRNWIVLFTVAARSRCAAITADNDFSVVSCLFCCALKRWWNGDTGPSSNWKWSNNFWFIAIDQSTRERTCSCFCVEADVLMIFITSHSVFQSNDELIHIFVLDTFASFFHIIALDLRP